MSLCRLIYKSQTSWEILSNESLRSLEETAQRRNNEAGITGLLVLSGEAFLQVLEGDSGAVNALYAKILKDTMHFRLELISYEQIGERCFEDWSMRLADLNDLPPAPRDVFRAKYRDRDGYVEIPDKCPNARAFLFDVKALCLAGAPVAGPRFF